MDLSLLIPVYGPTSSLYDIITDDDSSFAEKASASAQVGIVSGLSTIGSVAAFGYTQGVVNIARFAPPVAATYVAVTATIAATEVIIDQYSKFEPENVNERTSFWQGFSAALAGGFSMGGGIQIN